MNCYSGMVDQRKAFNFISTRKLSQRSSSLRISDTVRAGFEPAQNKFVEWGCAVVITTTPRCHCSNDVIVLSKQMFVSCANFDYVFAFEFKEYSFNVQYSILAFSYVFITMISKVVIDYTQIFHASNSRSCNEAHWHHFHLYGQVMCKKTVQQRYKFHHPSSTKFQRVEN